MTNKSLYESFLNSHVLVKREQELHGILSELICESLYESFLMSWSNKNQSCTRVDELAINAAASCKLYRSDSDSYSFHCNFTDRVRAGL